MLATRFATGELPTWPQSEGFVASALRDGGFRLDVLDSLGSTACLDWWPPYHESELPTLAREAFIHPVLSGPRYVESMLRYPPPESWFDPTSPLRRKLDLETPELVVPGLVRSLTARGSVAGMIALRQAVDDFGWHECAFDLDDRLRPFAEPGPPVNLALGCCAYQSSASPWSHAATPADDAALAVSGTVTGDYGFHTQKELQPWWQVDLGRPCIVREIRVFNRLTAESQRANHLSIWRSGNGRNWSLVHRHVSDVPFGGADGNPLIVSCGDGAAARFIRVELNGLEFLHLDEVEVWGVPLRSGSAPPQENREPTQEHEIIPRLRTILAERAPVVGTPGYTTPDLAGLTWLKCDGIDNWIGCPPSVAASNPSERVVFLPGATGSIVVLSGSTSLNAGIQIAGRGNIAMMGATTLWGGRLFVSFSGNDNLFFLGDRCAVNGVACNHKGNGSSIIIGDECLFSADVMIRTHDEHGIVDMQSGAWLNPPKSVLLEPHVWVGMGATIRQGVRVGFGSIVGEQAVVTRDVPRYSAVAGVPARVIRSGIGWTTDVQAGPHVVERLKSLEATLKA